jgi:hypothetical protein
MYQTTHAEIYRLGQIFRPNSELTPESFNLTESW